LAIGAAFAADYPVGAAQRFIQPHGVHHPVDAGTQTGVKRRQRGSAHAAGRARARQCGHVAAAGLRQITAPVRQGGVQLRHLGRAGAFLRCKHRAGAARAAQRVIHIAGDIHLHAGQRRLHGRQIQRGQLRQRRAAGRQRLAVRIQQARAQRLQHAGAAVLGGAAAQAQQDAPRALRQRGGDQLAHAVGAGAQGVALAARNPHQAGGLGHFNQGRFTVAQHGKTRIDRRAQRAAHGVAQQLAASGADQRIQRAFAAVGQRQAHTLRIRP